MHNLLNQDFYYYNLNSSLFLFDEELNEYYISFDSIYDKSVLNAIKTIANNIYNEILLLLLSYYLIIVMW